MKTLGWTPHRFNAKPAGLRGPDWPGPSQLCPRSAVDSVTLRRALQALAVLPAEDAAVLQLPRETFPNLFQRDFPHLTPEVLHPPWVSEWLVDPWEFPDTFGVCRVNIFMVILIRFGFFTWSTFALSIRKQLG